MGKEKERGVHTEMIRYAESLASNPENALNAIRSRNVTIRSLKAEIEHRKITAEEMEERMNLVIKERDALDHLSKKLDSALKLEKDQVKALQEEKEKLKIYLNEFENALIKVKTEMETIEKLKQDGWTNKVKELVSKLPQWSIVGPIMGFLLTPPTSRFVLIIVIVILLIASFIGWPGVAAQVAPIFKLFGVG